jgi:hypothetical protein
MSRLDRQGFLGDNSDQVLRELTVGCVGLGGGGSHVAQQLAHLGVGGLVLVDADIIEDTNLNRLVGGTADDVVHKRLKVEIAKRGVLGVNPEARVAKCEVEWQMALQELKNCDVVIGGLDSVIAKDDLDRFCRRHLIPYIDMGMDVHDLGGEYLIAGQVVLSVPGCPCLRCYGVVTDEGRAKEAQRYGAAGSRPQVVWPNGVLASLAVGTLTQMVTPWHRGTPPSYLEYDGNKNTVRISPRVAALAGRPCPHVLPTDVGDARFDVRDASAPQLPAEVLVDDARAPARLGVVRRLLALIRRMSSPPVDAA